MSQLQKYIETNILSEKKYRPHQDLKKKYKDKKNHTMPQPPSPDHRPEAHTGVALTVRACRPETASANLTPSHQREAVNKYNYRTLYISRWKFHDVFSYVQ